MTGPLDDRDLREQFTRLRRVQHEQAPSFVRATAPRADRSRAAQSLALAFAIVAILIVSVVLLPADVETTPTVDLRTTQWTAPTDFLLNVHGDWMLRDVPRIATPLPPQIDTTPRRSTS